MLCAREPEAAVTTTPYVPAGVPGFGVGVGVGVACEPGPDEDPQPQSNAARHMTCTARAFVPERVIENPVASASTIQRDAAALIAAD